MGVHGLTTYLRENKRNLSKTIQLSENNGGSIPVVVDAWSLIYALHQRCSLPWIYGGEYHEFSKLVTDVVQAWIRLGFKIAFVFDGPYPEIKFSTLLSRASKSIIEPSLLFFRTSAATRSAPHFLRETRIIPPLYFATTLHALELIQASTDSLEIHFADEECDPYAVELAGRLHGYVVGTDSDFVILNADGYQGYIPLDDMVWSATVVETEQEVVDDDGFQQVTNAKSRARATKAASSFGKGVIPPENVTDLTLSCSVFSPTVLAAHLSIPVTLLPLLASLAGNDFTNQEITTRLNIHALFFERGLSSPRRIERVASTIQSILAPNGKRKSKHQVGSVMDLIDRTVTSLTARVAHTLGPGQIDLVIDKVAEGALQYTIPKYERQHEGDAGLWPSRICALHVPDMCPLLPSFSRLLEAEAEAVGEDGSDELLMRIQIRTQYLDAYRKGHFAPLLVNCLTSGTSWPRLFIENPDVESVSRLTRPIRQWCYALLHDSLGLPGPLDEVEEETTLPPNSESESDEEELVDVVETDSDGFDSDGSEPDPLAPLRGALQNLRQHKTPAGIHSSTSSLRLLSGPHIVTEYIRRGTRLADEDVQVPNILDLLARISDSHFSFQTTQVPLVLQPENVRLTVMLRALGSDVPGIRAIGARQLSVVLVLRWVLRTMHERAEGANSKVRDAEKWTAQEARCFIASFTWGASGDEIQPPSGETNPPVVDRHLQLAAQILHTYDAVIHLSDTLFLRNLVAPAVHLFSGRAFHSYLTGVVECPSVDEDVWKVCMHGLEQTLATQRSVKKKGKKAKGERIATPITPTRSVSSGRYGMLGNTGF